jgi:hypothetical protein
MELRARIRPLSRRAAFAAASVALFASAVAGAVAPSAQAAKKKKAPVITSVAPKDVAVGESLTIRGRYFIPGRNKNTVVFKRDGARAVFVKAAFGTKKMLRVTVPATVQKYFVVKAGNPVPTRFRLRVLAKRFGKKFTSLKRSPLISGPRPPQAVAPSAEGDCDGDGVKNKNESDDDNDLLSDVTETAIGTDGCKLDTEGDGVEDGFEYQSAKDLNDDEYQNPNNVLPYPGKRPYPNPLFADSGKDYDGDSLTLADEQGLWKYTYSGNHTATRTLSTLSYSDGMQSSLFAYASGNNGRRVPAQPFSSYTMQQQFLDWAAASGYGTVHLFTNRPAFDPPVGSVAGEYSLRDVDLDGTVEPSETNVSDYDQNGFVSDDERDEDADGLSNYEELHGRLRAGYWSACYQLEGPFPIEYAGTNVVDGDSDGDGVRDGADDQDHDDVPNLMELSRMNASHQDDREGGVDCKVDSTLLLPKDLNGDGKPDVQVLNHQNVYGRVNPFNPCLPFTDARTCPRFHDIGGQAYAPVDLSPDYVAIQ